MCEFIRVTPKYLNSLTQGIVTLVDDMSPHICRSCLKISLMLICHVKSTAAAVCKGFTEGRRGNHQLIEVSVCVVVQTVMN